MYSVQCTPHPIVVHNVTLLSHAAPSPANSSQLLTSPLSSHFPSPHLSPLFISPLSPPLPSPHLSHLDTFTRLCPPIFCPPPSLDSQHQARLSDDQIHDGQMAENSHCNFTEIEMRVTRFAQVLNSCQYECYN